MLGEQLKKAFHDARIPSQEAADRMGMSKANLYILFKKDTFEVEYLRKACEITGRPMTYFFEGESNILDKKASDGGAFGEKIIGNMAAGIEELKEMFAEELSAKNQMIANLMESQKNLQRMLENVLGKFKGVTFTQLSEEEVFELTMGLYKYAGLRVSLGSLAGKPRPRRVKMPTHVKSVALSLT